MSICLLCISQAAAQDTLSPDNYTWVEVAAGFDNPLYVTYANDGTGRLFGVEQLGLIWIIEEGVDHFDPFLDVSNLISREVFSGGYSERGLLGLAFHPDYAQNGIFFINYTDIDGHTVVARYHVSEDDPNLADPDSAVTILTVQQPFPNHNGGHMAFGPDDYLYIALGDGGDQGDPYDNAQNLGSLLGKILRIDVNDDHYSIPEDNPFVDVEGAMPEIWAYGFRNPWRFSFDRDTNDLYIADVGEWELEEVNFQPADSTGGENYGWNLYEATILRADSEPAIDLVMPIATYSHVDGCSISGGYVYRGEAMPELQGTYFLGDYCNGNIWILQRGDDETWQMTLFMQTGYQISSFGEDQNGELYLVDYKGDILRLEPAPSS